MKKVATGMQNGEKIMELFRQVSFAGHRSHQNQKALNYISDVRITRDSQEVHRYFHATNLN